ncbi:uncharacterized protein [Pempheris klunzingeri]|uniref:uncharacterized protein n=1 Tax=Pempheris klunzingeri TaxID=3127111 RepID=UPI003980C2DF
MVVTVIVYAPRGVKTFVDLCDTQEQFKTLTVGDLVRKIQEKRPDDPLLREPMRLRLVFTGKILDVNKLLSAYGIQDKSTIHITLRLPWGGSGPGEGDGGMGDKEGKNRSMERLSFL